MQSTADPLLRNVPPHDEEAERAVIGAMLVRPEAIEDVKPILLASDYYLSAHAHVHEAILALARRSEPVDTETVAHELRQRVAAPLGVDTHPADLVDDLELASLTGANADYYARRVRDLALQRDLLVAARRITDWCYSRRDGEVLSDAERELLAVTSRRGAGRDPTPVGEIAQRVWDRILAADRGEQVRAVPTGYGPLDRLLGGGLPRGGLALVGARASMGKTALARCIALAASGRGAVPTVVYSLEVSEDDLVEQMMGTVGGYSTLHLRQPGGLAAIGAGRASATLDTLTDEHQLWVHDARLSLDQLVGSVRRMARLQDVGLVLVDYLQLVDVETRGRPERRHEEVGRIARRLKGVAADLGVAVVALAQLNREGTKRSDPRPQLADLRDSGELEQHADVVLLLHRPSYYGRDGRDLAIVAKNRHGPTGDVPMRWVGESMRWEAVAP